MIGHMRHMGNSGRIAIGAFLAAVALLVLTGVTLHESVFVWFLAASAAAYVACVAEVVIRRRHKTLVASGIGSMLFLAFGIAFLRQWGLAFNADPGALSAPVDTAYPDLYFYLAAASGAATLLLLFAGTVLPGRRRTVRAYASRPPASAPRPGASGQTSRGTSSTARGAARGTAGRPAPRAAAATTAASRTATPRPAARVPAAKSPATKSPAQSPARPSARTSARR
jgi:hypothetical protein